MPLQLLGPKHEIRNLHRVPRPVTMEPAPAPRPRSLRRCLAVAALFTLLAFSAPAAVPGASPSVSDVVLARSALSAIDSDPMVRDVNVLVSVVDRVAVVGGPVPSTEHARRAEGIVRRIPGIVEVKNRCFVQEPPDPLLKAMSGGLPPFPRRLSASELPSVVASPRTGRVEEFTPSLGGTSLAAVVPAEKSVVARRPSNPSDSVLLPPVDSSAFNPTRARGVSVAPAAPVVLTSRPGDVLAAAEAIRRENPRYSKLSITVASGTYVVSGNAARMNDAWELIQQLRKIPGIQRVAIGQITIK